MTTANFNIETSNFIKELTIDSYALRNTFHSMNEAAVSINLNTSDSGHYTPKAIKVKGIEGVLFLRQDGKVNVDYKVLGKDGKFEVYELSFKSYNEYERYISSKM